MMQLITILDYCLPQQEEKRQHWSIIRKSRCIGRLMCLYHIILAICTCALVILEEAQKSYTKFIAGSTVLADAYNNLGLVYIKKGELNEAMVNFQAASAD